MIHCHRWVTHSFNDVSFAHVLKSFERKTEQIQKRWRNAFGLPPLQENGLINMLHNENKADEKILDFLGIELDYNTVKNGC